MAKKGLAKRHKRKAASPASLQQSAFDVALIDAHPPRSEARAVTQIEAQLDVAGAVKLREELMQSMSRGAVQIEVSEGKPTQPAIQLLVAARNSARSGHDLVFADAAAAVLQNVIEEGVSQ